MTDDTHGTNDGGLTAAEPRRLWPIVAPIVLVLLAAMLVFTVGSGLLEGDDDDKAQAKTPGPESPNSAQSPTDPNASRCGLPGFETSGTVSEPPTDATWTQVGAQAIPISPSAGPGVVEESQVRYCYAHTPEGAVLAAMNLYAWGVAGTSDPVGVVENGIAEGPGYDEALSMATGRSAEPPSNDPAIQIVGFQVVSYASDAASVSVAFASGLELGYAQQTLELLWDRGDWRVRATLDGSLPPATVTPDLAGYVLWSGA